MTATGDGAQELTKQWMWCPDCVRRFYVDDDSPGRCPVCRAPGSPVAPPVDDD